MMARRGCEEGSERATMRVVLSGQNIVSTDGAPHLGNCPTILFLR